MADGLTFIFSLSSLLQAPQAARGGGPGGRWAGAAAACARPGLRLGRAACKRGPGARCRGPALEGARAAAVPTFSPAVCQGLMQWNDAGTLFDSLG
jgi:hypothetical protein